MRGLAPPSSCTVLVAALSGSRPPIVAHTFDTPGGVDFRLVRVPADPNPPSPRPVYRRDEARVPRFSGGDNPAYRCAPSGGQKDVATMQPVGSIPQIEGGGGTFAYWEAASGIINEAGVSIAESTCSAIFGSTAGLLGYMDLTRIALERCSSAREAVLLMGGLVVEHGFVGNTAGLTGCAEALAVADSKEAWIMHLMADDTGTSAIWAAQRVPDGHASVVANMFVIREMDFDNPDEFLVSDTAKAVSQRHMLWAPGTPFEFAAIFSAGEARHRFYSGRRMWRALSLFAPSLRLDPSCDDLLLEKPYPVSVAPDETLGRHDFFRIMRDTYQGTAFDLSNQSASGPFGMTDRYDGANETPKEGNGAFERPIGVYRMAYSYVCEPSSRLPLFHFGPHTAQTGVYFPILSAMDECPEPLARGTVKAIDRSAAYWAFRIVKHTARGLPWNHCLDMINERQRKWEKLGTQIVDAASSDVEEISEALHQFAKDVVADWWKLNDEMLLRFGDGWEFSIDDDGAFNRSPVAYPVEWLEQVGFFGELAPPAPTLWMLEKKRARLEGIQRS